MKNKADNINDKVGGGSIKIKGTVILMKKNFLDFNDVKASLLDRIHELLGKGVSMHLISSVHPEPGQHLPQFLENLITETLFNLLTLFHMLVNFSIVTFCYCFGVRMCLFMLLDL